MISTASASLMSEAVKGKDRDAVRRLFESVHALLELAGPDWVRSGSHPNVSTFHSLCVRLLRRDGDPLSAIRPGFTYRRWYMRAISRIL